MNGKTSNAKPKMADVTRPKKSTSAEPAATPLVIQSRPIIGRATALSSPSEDESANPDMAPSQPETPSSAPVLPSQSKRTLIVPISDRSEKEDTSAKEESPVATTAAEEVPAQDTSKDDTVAEAPKEADSSEKPKPADDMKADGATKDTEKTKEKLSDKADVEKSDSDDENADKKADKPNAETEKAVAEAAAAAKREHELESLIDSKQFYVPINAVARKREVKHSALMTVLVLLLAIVLIDLMLDSGLILLAEKIPHTHFFTISNLNP